MILTAALLALSVVSTNPAGHLCDPVNASVMVYDGTVYVCQWGSYAELQPGGAVPSREDATRQRELLGMIRQLSKAHQAWSLFFVVYTVTLVGLLLLVMRALRAVSRLLSNQAEVLNAASESLGAVREALEVWLKNAPPD